MQRNESSAEREYARYLDEIEVRKQRVVTAHVDLETLRSDLDRVETEYYARVGMLLIELDRVKLAIEECERRIGWMHAHPETSAAEIEADIEESFAVRRQQLRDDEATIRFAEEQFEEDRRFPALDPSEEEELRRRYAALVMRLHPDLARTEFEASAQRATMQRIDAAFRARDLDALRTLEHEPAYTDPEFDARPIDEQLVWAIREMTRVFDLRMTLGRELTDLRMNDTFKLWTQLRTEPDAIGRLAQEVEADIESARARLAASTETWRELTHHRTHE